MVKGLVLIIEDDPDLGKAVADVLEMLDFETELVADGSLAFDRIPDVVLCKSEIRRLLMCLIKSNSRILMSALS